MTPQPPQRPSAWLSLPPRCSSLQPIPAPKSPYSSTPARPTTPTMRPPFPSRSRRRPVPRIPLQQQSLEEREEREEEGRETGGETSADEGMKVPEHGKTGYHTETTSESEPGVARSEGCHSNPEQSGTEDKKHAVGSRERKLLRLPRTQVLSSEETCSLSVHQRQPLPRSDEDGTASAFVV
ncbi:hypothetical protein fugu_003941 [Takifugu bimaculatus]|uniref:Uncharacterized protein n=1 Tax=Takifugu bimaculatus TaxID=433685 RepID=A0A4Z2BD03_9TELE|nr:hypothetical protein fugu_003941 [Takifugu bimaculatus]